jgi:uncharacterized protein (TIGR01777 family)
MSDRRIVVAGGSGFLGRVLAAHFTKAGREVVILARNPKEPDEVRWDAATLGPWARELEGADAVINLTGRTVNCRYNAANRRAIMDSRLHSTRVIGEAIRQCKEPPRVWLNASTATIYKHTFGPPHDEHGEIGATPEAHDAFSIEVAQAWERALDEAHVQDTRKVALRAAMILGHGENSVFPMLRRLTRVGLGGRMGGGRQYVSWIHERDFCRAIDWILEREEFAGVVNIAAPNPVTNAEMMQLLRQAVGAPFGLPAYEWMLHIGAFALRTEVELIIKSRRVIPKRLLDSGFRFEFPTMREAFAELTRRVPSESPLPRHCEARSLTP